MARSHVDLGFAEKCEDYWRLLSHYFPSKLGGPPAWLGLTGVPDYEMLKCCGCGKTCKFLLQIYSPAPLDNDSSAEQQQDSDDAFHRTLYVFVCAETSCSQRSFRCFRSQLPQENEFYSSSPPNDKYFDEACSYPKVSDFLRICGICHCSASKLCAKCKDTAYCSKDHQALDWKTGHKLHCSTSLKGRPQLHYNLIILLLYQGSSGHLDA